MLETLKKVAMKGYLIRIIISLVIIVAMLAVTGFAIVDVITGPKKLDITKDPAEYEGKYVTMTVDNLLTDYVEHFTETTYKTGAKSTSTDGNSYIAFYTDNDYENQASTWYYYSIFLPESKTDEAYAMIDATWEYWADETNTVAPPEPMTITGTWTAMEGEMLGYYESTLTTDLEFAEGPGDVFVRYTVATDKIGPQNAGAFWIFMGIAVLALLYLIITLVRMFGKGYLKKINEFLHQNTTVSMGNLEEDFSAAHKIEKGNVWVGRNWTFAISGVKAQILANKDAVWAYYYKRTGKRAVSQLQVYRKDKSSFIVSLSEERAKEALSYYEAEQPHIVVGYTDEWQKMYNKEFEKFLDMKYNPVKQQEANNDPFAGTQTYNY